ncbi:hypothetical protein JAO29_13925 [Edaphobacter sp. HDX4]|uniref:hypothetical protein n=1 Tax=Edaphobacter sp. HDX4 TaxID=2794064 RepID=UPI002FE5A09D
MLFVTFHGGKPDKHLLLNNVHAYDKNGKRITSSVLDETNGIELNELRGICLRNDLLYVVVANKGQNRVLCYEGKETKYSFVSTFVSQAICPALIHPFDLTFDDAGFCYVSNQDSNTVTRLKVAKDGRTGTPAEIAPALEGQGNFLTGTFVASSVGSLTNPATTAIAAPMGLGYSDAGSKKHSVRGILWVNDALYVVDQPSSRVKVYNKDGRYLGQSNEIESPVHLAVRGDCLYVSGANDVLTAKLKKPAGDFELALAQGLQIKNGSGMAFTEKGKLYLASRTENIIRKYDADFKPTAFDCDLPDNPEFLLYVREGV